MTLFIWASAVSFSCAEHCYDLRRGSMLSVKNGSIVLPWPLCLCLFSAWHIRTSMRHKENQFIFSKSPKRLVSRRCHILSRASAIWSNVACYVGSVLVMNTFCRACHAPSTFAIRNGCTKIRTTTIQK